MKGIKKLVLCMIVNIELIFILKKSRNKQDHKAFSPRSLERLLKRQLKILLKLKILLRLKILRRVKTLVKLNVFDDKAIPWIAASKSSNQKAS